MPDTPTDNPAAIEPNMAGRQLGGYHLLRRLGRGGMAEVYLAEQSSLRRQVALKVLRSSLAGDRSYIRRFHHEAQAAAKLVHANIVQIYEVGCIEGVHFIAQEYVPGQNLKQVLGRAGALEVPLAVNIMRQVGAALHKAAQQGIIHRDIKPENIMLTPSGEVKVADFGLARVVVDGEQVDLTQVGITMGTPLYMSPEQVEGRAVDPRSDVYSLGVTSYQMLAGRPPFEGETPLAVAVKHIRNEPKRLESIREDLPEGLCRVVHRMLAKQPRDRYQQPADLIRDLRQLNVEGLDEHWPEGLDELTSDALMIDGRIAATQRLDAMMKSQALLIRNRRTLLLTLGGVIGAFSIGIAAAALSRPRPLLQIDPTDIPKIEQFETARQQFFHALELNTEQGYLAIEKYHPPNQNSLNEYYSRVAHQHLAQFYRENDQLRRAQSEYDKLAGLDDAHFAVVGLFGQANLLADGGKELAAKSRLYSAARLWDGVAANQKPQVRQVLDERLRNEFQAALDSQADQGQPGET